MARMCPPEVRPGTPSSAERRLFDRFRDQLGDDWIVLHSLGLAFHPTKPWAEIDFVLIGPSGVFAIEVKGGRVERRDGRYYFTNIAGQTTAKSEGPFEQVASASAQLYKHLASSRVLPRDAVVGHAVMLPDIRFEVESPDFEPALVYDSRDADKPVSAFVRRIANYWHDRVEVQRCRPVESLSKSDRQEVLAVLRGDFDLKPPLWFGIREAGTQLLKLTEEQYRVLGAVHDNERVLVRGGAGTGKTLLAVEEARRRSADGQRVLLCCYNRRLGVELAGRLADSPLADVAHLHGLMRRTVAQAGLADELPDTAGMTGTALDGVFDETYPRICLEAVDRLGLWEHYDALVVDEAQDLLREPYLDVLDALLRGGLKEGVWTVFLDTAQSIYTGEVGPVLGRLESARPVQLKLTANCRNTKPVAVMAELLSSVRCGETYRAEGPDTEHFWCASHAQASKAVSDCVCRLLADRVPSQSIVVLSPFSLAHSCLRDGLPGRPARLVDAERAGPGEVLFSTIASFKGLEADAVLLVDLQELSGNNASMLVYVGATRARSYLAVFLDERLKPEYARRAGEYGRRLAEDALG